MKPIEGIDLSAEFQETERQALEERRQEVRRKIRAILGRNTEAQGSIAKLGRDLAKAQESLKKSQERLQRIQAGDWQVLQDEEQQKEQAS